MADRDHMVSWDGPSIMPGYRYRVPLVAAAVCPHPPLLVPEIAGGAASELDDLRAACDLAVARLGAARPDVVIVVGAGERTEWLPSLNRATLAPWGLPLEIRLRPEPGDGSVPVIPLSLTIGAWLLSRRPPAVPVAAATVAATAPVDTAAALGARLVGARLGRFALLVMGDGSASRGRQAADFDDPRAEEFDRRVVAALAGADARALLDLDAGLAGELLAAGRPAWQVLAGAVLLTASDWRGNVHYSAAPYGVSYFVASWTPGTGAAPVQEPVRESV